MPDHRLQIRQAFGEGRCRADDRAVADRGQCGETEMQRFGEMHRGAGGEAGDRVGGGQVQAGEGQCEQQRDIQIDENRPAILWWFTSPVDVMVGK